MWIWCHNLSPYLMSSSFDPPLQTYPGGAHSVWLRSFSSVHSAQKPNPHSSTLTTCPFSHLPTMPVYSNKCLVIPTAIMVSCVRKAASAWTYWMRLRILLRICTLLHCTTISSCNWIYNRVSLRVMYWGDPSSCRRFLQIHVYFLVLVFPSVIS